VELDDIVQAGMIGLMDAASRYEESHGTQFETFATQRIRGAMLDELRQNDWMPRATRRNQRRIDTAVRALEQRLGRAPNDKEIAAELGVCVSEYHEMWGDAKSGQLFSLDGFEADDGEESLPARQHADPSAGPDAQLEDQRFRGALIEAIETLPERERQLMGLYYEQELNFREIAAVLGVTESRVCQLHAKAVSRIRAQIGDWQAA
jgi:RNA polymerase sigma factor for flagellar operon FliA